MLKKRIITGTGVDGQNQQITLPALMELVDELNNSEAVPRMSLDHDRALPPIGKIISGELIPCNGEILLEATIDEFIDEFTPCVGPTGEELYIGRSSSDSRPFKEEPALQDTHLIVKLNPIHFSKDNFEEVTAYLQNECNSRVETTIEKGLDPIVQVIFVFAGGFFTGVLIPKIKEKTAEKLSNVISDDIVKGYELLKKAIGCVTKKITAIGKKNYIFIDPEQPVEFVVKARNADEVMCAFDALNEFDHVSVVERFKHYTNGNLNKIQFCYDIVDNRWEMTYLTTNDGEVIGTEASYKKAVKMYQAAMESPTAGLSIAGSATISDSECKDNI